MEDKLILKTNVVMTRLGSKISVPTRLFHSKKFKNRFLKCEIWQICGTHYDVEVAKECLMKRYSSVQVIQNYKTHELGLLNWWTEKMSNCEIKSNLKIQDLGVYFGGHTTGLNTKTETFETTEIRFQCFI